MFIDTVKQNAARLTERDQFKFAMDFAELLEWATERFLSHADKGKLLASMYRETFERFNACLVQCDGEPLCMDSRWALPLAHLGHNSNFESKTLHDILATSPTFNKLSGLRTADQMLRALGEELEDSYSARRAFHNIDAMLCVCGLPQSRAWLMQVELKSAAARLVPDQPLTALCVDDNSLEIMTTLSKMAGWERLTLAVHRQPRPPMDDTEEATTERLANEVIATGAEIVLMDYNLVNAKGSKVIEAVGRIDPKGKRVFVANTSGAARGPFEGTGAIGNCQKGANLDSVEEAIRKFFLLPTAPIRTCADRG